MNERSDEVTEPGRRDRDLLEETDGLRSDSSAGAGRASNSSDAGQVTAPTDSSRSWRAALTSRLSLARYFSPKAYAALVVVLGIGLVVGAAVLPIAGRLIGTFATAFVTGLLASKRRYLEVTAAGISVGGVAAVLNNAVLAVAGSGQTLVAVGATVGLLATVGGYYFGRDLRDGLARELE